MAQVPYVNEATYLNVSTSGSVRAKGNHSEYPKRLYICVCTAPMIHLVVPSEPFPIIFCTHSSSPPHHHLAQHIADS